MIRSAPDQKAGSRIDAEPRLLWPAVVLSLAQLAALGLLYSRWLHVRSATPLPGLHSVHPALGPKLALAQGIGHLLGTGVLILLLFGRGAAGTLEGSAEASANAQRRTAVPTLLVLGLSTLVWLAGAVGGFPNFDSIAFYGGIVGLLIGFIMPIISMILLIKHKQPIDISEEARGVLSRRRSLLYFAYVATWLWSLAFAASQFAIGVAA